MERMAGVPVRTRLNAAGGDPAHPPAVDLRGGDAAPREDWNHRLQSEGAPFPSALRDSRELWEALADTDLSDRTLSFPGN